MQLSFNGGLLGAVLYNQNRQQSRVRLFETGLSLCQMPMLNLACVRICLSAVITGTAKSEHWAGKQRSVDFFDLKGDCRSVLSLTKAV